MTNKRAKNLLFNIIIIALMLFTSNVYAEDLTPNNNVDENIEKRIEQGATFNQEKYHSNSSEVSYAYAVARTDGTFDIISEHASYKEAKKVLDSEEDVDGVVLCTDKVVAMKEHYGIAVITSSSYTVTIDNYNYDSDTYIPRNSVLYYSHSSSTGATALCAISGARSYIPMSKLKLIPDAHMAYRASSSFANKNYNIDYYYVSDDTLYHTYYMYNGSSRFNTYSFSIDKAPEFMVEGERYYSYDGVNFYSDYTKVFTEDTVGVYYPYYKYLNFRTQTNYTASEINSYINYSTDSDSVLRGLGDTFISAETNYGMNAVMELAFANLESGYGSSSLAINRYNLFGIEAYDGEESAGKDFSSPAECINYHARVYINRGYADAFAYIDSSKDFKTYYSVADRTDGLRYSGDSRYRGSFFGNKNMGLNVKYASDPYHGEKNAGRAYAIDKHLGLKDYENYTIGLTNCSAVAYSEPNTSSYKLYKYCINDTRDDLRSYPAGMSVVILGQTGDFYIVQSDMTVNEDKRSFFWDYNYENSLAYVKKSDIDIVRKSKFSAEIETPKLTYVNVGENYKQLKVMWAPVKDASSYKVAIYNYTYDKWYYYDTTKTELIVNTAMGGRKYKVKICSFVGVDQSEYTREERYINTVEVPTITKAETLSDKVTLDIQWEKVDGADGYNVEIYDYSSKAWSSFDVKDNSFEYSSMSSKNKYKVKLASYTINDKNVRVYSDYTPENEQVVIEVDVDVVAPSSTSASIKDTYNEIEVSWLPARNATSYRVAVFDCTLEKWDYYDTAKTEYIVADLEAGRKYKIKVCSLVGKIESAYDEYEGEITIIKTPTITKAGALPDYTTLDIHWDMVDGADGYVLKIYNYTYKKWYQYDITTDYFNLKTAMPNRKYKVKIASYILKDGKKIYSDYTPESEQKIFTTSVDAPPITYAGIGDNTNELRVKWNKVDDATSYRVAIYNHTYEKWYYYNTTSTSLDVQTAVEGRKYTIRVRSFVGSNGSSYTSSEDESIIVTAKTPDITKATNLKDRKTLDIAWTKVDGASSYRVAIYNYTYKKWYYYNTTDTKLNVGTAVSNRKYKVLVASVVKNDTDEVYRTDYSSGSDCRYITTK